MKILIDQLTKFKKPTKIEYFDTVSSTNLVAKERLLQGEVQGAIIANQQSAGRGTNDRKFYSPATGLYFSTYFQVDQVPSPGRLTANVGTLVSDIIQEQLNIQVGIKWINDLYRNNQKVGGILCELITDDANQIVGVVIGIGLNLNTVQFPDQMFRVGGVISGQASELTATKLFETIVEQIIKQRHFLMSNAVGKNYLDKMILTNQLVQIDQGTATVLTGIVEGVTEDNQLILRVNNIPQIISSGRILSWSNPRQA